MRNTQLRIKVGAELRTAATADTAVIESLPEESREASRAKLAKIREQQQAKLDDEPQPTIFAAASLGNPVLLTELVRHFDPRLADADGWTPLMAAARATLLAREDAPAEASSTVQCLNILLPLSDPMAETSLGRTALMFAGSAHAANLLLPVSDPKARDDHRRTALMHAVLDNRPAVVAALLEVSNVDAESEEGATALDYALGFGHRRARVKLAGLLAPLATSGIDQSLERAVAVATSKAAEDAAARNAWRLVVDELASRASVGAAKAALAKFRALDFPRTSSVLAERSSD
jgi:hypothetical protein